MSKQSGSTAAFISVVTVHQAQVSWWWTAAKLHDTDYHIRVNESVAAKVRELESKYDVQDDTRYCCQGEGHLLMSESREQVEAAANELARYLAKFRGLAPLPA
jgi:hypothetical protein